MSEEKKPRKSRARGAKAPRPAGEGETTPTGDAPPPSEHFIATPAPDLLSAPTAWLWEPWVPSGAVTLVIGPPEVGKSSFLSALAAHACGARPLDGKKKGKPGHALILPGEEPLSYLRARLEAAAGRQSARCLVLRPANPGPGSFRLSFPSGIEELRGLIRQTRARLVTIDPADSYMDPTLSENNNFDVRRLLEPLQQLAEEEDIAVVAVRHPGKEESNAILGSVAWRNVPRAICQLSPGNDPGEYLLSQFKWSGGAHALPLKYKLAPAGKSIIWTPAGQADLSLQTLFAPQQQGPALREAVQDTCRLLYALLREGQMEVPEVWTRCRAEAVTESCFRQAKRVLGVKTKRVGFGPGSKCYLVPPKIWPTWLV